jgi:sensor histidine kinase YesM
VENAIKHGLKKKETSGSLHVLAQEQNGEFLFQVSDNGVGLTKSFKEILLEHHPAERDNLGIGLRNIHMRLLYLGASEGLRIRSEKGKGTEVSFTLSRRLACPHMN